MRKTVVISLFAISLLVLTGIGYAQFTSTAYVNGTASAGTLDLFFSSGVTNGVTSVAGTCTVGTSGGQLDISFTNVAPGDICNFIGTIENSGSLPATSVSLTYYAWQTYGPGAVVCSTSTGDGNCISYEQDYLTGTSGPTINLETVPGPACSPDAVGSTFATAAICPLPWSDIAPYASGFSIAASSDSATYTGYVQILGQGSGEFSGQLGAQQGQSAYFQVQITGSVGT
jgi:hypothetical protein